MSGWVLAPGGQCQTFSVTKLFACSLKHEMMKSTLAQGHHVIRKSVIIMACGCYHFSVVESKYAKHGHGFVNGEVRPEEVDLYTIESRLSEFE